MKPRKIYPAVPVPECRAYAWWGLDACPGLVITQESESSARESGRMGRPGWGVYIFGEPTSPVSAAVYDLLMGQVFTTRSEAVQAVEIAFLLTESAESRRS